MSNPSIHKLGPLGAEPEFSESARMVQETVHRFAEEVMRPVGIKLDRMTPEEVIAPGSSYWDALRQFKELGFGVEGLLALEPAERAKTMCILFEELGWGDAGLAISFGVTLLPALMSRSARQPVLPRGGVRQQGRLLGHHRARPRLRLLDANRMIFHPVPMAPELHGHAAR
jgi:hypothetical protein